MLRSYPRAIVKNRANCAAFAKIARASGDITHIRSDPLTRNESGVYRGRPPRDAHVCNARAAAGCHYVVRRGKPLRYAPVLFRGKRARSRIYRVNASAFLPSLRARCGPLFVPVLFAMRNGTHTKEFNVRENAVRYETIYAHIYYIQNKYIVFCYYNVTGIVQYLYIIRFLIIIIYIIKFLRDVNKKFDL